MTFSTDSDWQSPVRTSIVTHRFCGGAFLFHYGSRLLPTNTQLTRMPKATISVTTTPAQNIKNSMKNHVFRRVPNARIDGTHSPTNNPYCFASSGLPAHAPPRNHKPTLRKKLNPAATKMLPVRTCFIVSSFENGGETEPLKTLSSVEAYAKDSR